MPILCEICSNVRMEKTDTRKRELEIQELLRVLCKQIVRLCKSVKRYKEIGEIVGIHPTNACKILKSFERHGQEAAKANKRGRKSGSCRTLEPEQETRLKKAIADKTPDQFKFPFALWTRKAVQGLIKEPFYIEMPIRTVGEYLKRWGHSAKAAAHSP